MGDNVFAVSGHTMNLGVANTQITTTSTGPWQPKGSPHTAIQATVTGTGTVGATVIIEVSNDGVNAVGTPAGTITLTGTTVASDGFITSNAPWKYIRYRVTAISGTGAVVAVVLGI